MELVFEAQSIDYLRPVFTKTAAQEQTQELIVPDSYPDCGRIVFTGACAVMRGKEARDGSVVVTGGVRAGLLYVPEDGTGPRALSCYLPYSIRVDDPAATAAMQLQACCHVRSADARLINSRKILVRADVICLLTTPPLLCRLRIVRRFFDRKWKKTGRKNETLRSLLKLLVWTRKFYRVNLPQIRAGLEPYRGKVVELKTKREIYSWLEKQAEGFSNQSGLT